MPGRAVSQAASVSRPAGNTPTPSVVPTSLSNIEDLVGKTHTGFHSQLFSFLLPLPPTPVTGQAAPVSTVIVTSILAPIVPATTSSPAPVVPTAVFTTVTQVLTTVGTSTPVPAYTAPHTTAAPTNSVDTALVGTTGAVYGPPRSSSGSFARAASSSTARASASVVHSSTPVAHKPKSNTGKYVGYAIGAVFFLTLISSFISAYRKHRKYVRKRPRGSIFIGSKLSDGQSSPQKRSMAQALMRSVSNTSFDAYALSNTPPTSPPPVYLNGSQQAPPDINRARGFSPSTSPIPPRPLPPTPTSIKYPIHEEDSVFYPHVPSPVDPHEYSPSGISS
ncbi:C2H2-type domain-containing protein [Mycena venus]|uniref:C2H2-type domain-containing protein n=1 Tax=Mycena venus TaxID=2733690 RepID=A0A8H6YNJ5_9AGAR|nr:C2H2-type domain-containing protein [Mycena venus]